MPYFFTFKQSGEDEIVREFVFAIEDAAKAEEARAIIRDPNSSKRQVSGTIVKEPAWYNPGWSFHLDPNSIGFFEFSMEVCDANITWVEDNLGEIGGSALPGQFWCPWSSKLDREVFPEPAEPSTELNKHGKLNYIEFPARDLVATKAFFEAAFGWSFADYGPEYAAFSNEGLDGGFYKSDMASSVAGGASLLIFYSKDLESTLAQVQKAGGHISKPIYSFPGGHRFHFVEPSGNELAVWSDVGA